MKRCVSVSVRVRLLKVCTIIGFINVSTVVNTKMKGARGKRCEWRDDDDDDDDDDGGKRLFVYIALVMKSSTEGVYR